MAYFSQDRKQEMAPKIKEITKKYGVKATLGVRHNSEVVLSIASGKIDFIGNAKAMETKRGMRDGESYIRDYIQVNQYHMDKNFDGEALKFLEEVYAVLNGGNHDNSDAQVDYFDVGWYISINVGKWDKPYIFEGKAE